MVGPGLREIGLLSYLSLPISVTAITSMRQKVTISCVAIGRLHGLIMSCSSFKRFVQHVEQSRSALVWGSRRWVWVELQVQKIVHFWPVRLSRFA